MDIKWTIDGNFDKATILWGDSSDSLPNARDLGAVLELQDAEKVLGLIAGQKYYFQVVPYYGGVVGYPTDIYGITLYAPRDVEVIEIPPDDMPAAGGVLFSQGKVWMFK